MVTGHSIEIVELLRMFKEFEFSADLAAEGASAAQKDNQRVLDLFNCQWIE
jgi:hypothetical protein